MHAQKWSVGKLHMGHVSPWLPTSTREDRHTHQAILFFSASKLTDFSKEPTSRLLHQPSKCVS
jgi:hypothetical protein